MIYLPHTSSMSGVKMIGDGVHISLVPRPLYAHGAHRNKGLVSTIKTMNILNYSNYAARCGAPVHDVLRMNIPIKFTTTWQPGMQYYGFYQCVPVRQQEFCQPIHCNRVKKTNWPLESQLSSK